MLDSYQSLLGRPLVDRQGSDLVVAERLYRAAFVVVAHGTGPDPVLSYGNAVALALWEMHADAFTRTPSRLTAEPAAYAVVVFPIHSHAQIGPKDEAGAIRAETRRNFMITEVAPGVSHVKYVVSLDLKGWIP